MQRNNLSEHRALTQALMYKGMQMLTSQVMRWVPTTSLQGSEARSCFCFKLRQIDCDSTSDETVDQPVQCTFLQRRACQDGTARVRHSTIVSSQRLSAHKSTALNESPYRMWDWSTRPAPCMADCHSLCLSQYGTIIVMCIVALVRVRVRVRCRTRCAHRRTGFLPGAAEKAKKC